MRSGYEAHSALLFRMVAIFFVMLLYYSFVTSKLRTAVPLMKRFFNGFMMVP